MSQLEKAGAWWFLPRLFLCHGKVVIMKNIDNILCFLQIAPEEFWKGFKDIMGLVLLDEEEDCGKCSTCSGCDPDRYGLCRDCSTRKNIFELKAMISQLEEMGL